MAKSKHLFTLSPDASMVLKDKENKSAFAEQAIIFYEHNKDKKFQTEPKFLENVGIEI